VTITGVSLRQTSRVAIGGKAAGCTVTSDTELTATVPVEAKTAKFTITTPRGAATSGTSLTVN